MTTQAPINHQVTPGQRVITQNTGVKRIFGVDLKTQAKIENWLFFLEDIKTAVVYANDGTEIWYSALGQPAAGSAIVRDALVPFEGQRYYVIEEDIAYEFKGGAWNGTVFEGNTIQPKINILEIPQKMVVGLEHLLAGNGEYILPTTNIKDGHEIQFSIYDGLDCTLVTEDESSLVIGSIVRDITTGGQGPLPLSTGVMYHCVFYQGRWSMFFNSASDYLRRDQNLRDVVDVVEARANLGVQSTQEALQQVDEEIDKTTFTGGLVSSGSSAQNNKEVRVDFATLEEAEDTSITNKALAPATIVPAVNTANRENQHNNITGLLPAEGESKFDIVGTIGGTTISLPEFTCAFNSEPYLRQSPLQLITYAANTLSIPNVLGTVTHQVVARDDGTISLQTTRPLKSSVTEVLLGGVITVNGQLFANSEGAPSIGVYPRLASSDYALRNSDAEVGNVTFAASNVTAGTVTHTAFDVLEEGVNWENSTSLPHTKNIAAADPAKWTVIDSSGNITASDQTEVNGEELDDGTNVPDNSYSIQLVFTSIEGDLVLLKGQVDYATIDAARADVFAYQPVIPANLASFVEVARWIVRGDQHTGSPSLDLLDPANFQSFTGSDVVATSVPNNAADITSSNNDNNLQSTNLQQQINELSNRGSIVPLTSQTIERSRIYRIDFAGTKSLPSASPAGQVIGFYARSTDLSGILEVADTGTETLFFASEPAVTDTQLAIDTPAQYYWLRSNGTQWEITNA